MIQRYAITQRLQVDFDQLSVANHSSTSESSSSRLSYSSLEENRNYFKQVFDSNKEEKETLDYAFETIRRYPKFRIVISIMRWVDSKEFSGNLDNNVQ
ncbi:hypothetical protein C1645_830315 [Glomus cerebriforme]|uniref:Uncharacterized protein n=1 Tax=Glomus cerebriforme TaxID=658196 RepID=A0A397SSW5_9GLOM|nr:hypothetical protein C1645_830315 [Glomus cerebriforme]